MLRFICLSLLLLAIAHTTLSFSHTDIVSEYTSILQAQTRIRQKILNSELALTEINLFNKTAYHKSTLASTYTSYDKTTFNYGGCTCQMLFCVCCARIQMPQVDLNSTVGCMELAYNNSLNLMSSEFTLSDRRHVMSESFEASEEPTFCYEVIENKTICLEYYSLVSSFDNQLVKGCIELSGRIGNESVATIRMGCFSMFLEVGHSYFLKEMVSMHSKSGRANYVSRNNPLVFSPFFF